MYSDENGSTKLQENNGIVCTLFVFVKIADSLLVASNGLLMALNLLLMEANFIGKVGLQLLKLLLLLKGTK